MSTPTGKRTPLAPLTPQPQRNKEPRVPRGTLSASKVPELRTAMRAQARKVREKEQMNQLFATVLEANPFLRKKNAIASPKRRKSLGVKHEPRKSLGAAARPSSRRSLGGAIAGNTSVPKPHRVRRSSLTKTPRTWIPTEFVWEAEGAHEVLLAGSFNDWADKIPLRQKEGGGFQLTMDLPPGRVHFKYIVDGNWCCAPTHATEYDSSGNQNNVMEIH
eukprot:TRINITY_DN20035_c0_g1_i1.p1 TRINITY_DN20035_c0_g1~~TRINITY_DN20035_c0_g1_i1.p1  ORF type:complete len:237 (+),score=33.57 TRINITY_DN20035_c0_g1_i1:58-711(+)